ncbi:hypothetical protein S140_155 [Shewanella sp. phage 1/40]|uniref:virion structural protein n=1 Tax=Shewanella phage 1/4 TaxID=1458859 RepID=UPI0004F71C01|nr:virion structural protein [Shewanella sp. phage 1/4]YP_009104153.1 virion structural protein [Shewanella sp. phage 1/40]AHK11261.1 hypothetical protein S14_152 [Shewanella sp. phage 1/4]AHK11562.1 hypothetical protein S140_155 [Shewanella sp. phage 1/40]
MTLLYEAASIEAAWNGITLDSGRVGDGAFLEFTPVGDLSEISWSSNGEMGISKLAQQGAVITLTLKQTAPLNAVLARIVKEQTKKGVVPIIAPFRCVDKFANSAHFVALNATLTAQPTQSFANTMGDKVWTWTCETYLQTDSITEITEQLRAWLQI